MDSPPPRGRDEGRPRGKDNVGVVWPGKPVHVAALTPLMHDIVQYATANPRFASTATAAAIAAEVGADPATVVRCAQRMGFSGWTEFRSELRRHYLRPLVDDELMRELDEPDSSSPFEAAVRRDIQNLQACLKSVPQSDAEEAAAIIATAPRTVVITSGSWTAPGLILAQLAQWMGFNVTHEYRGGHHVAVALASLDPGDCVIAISFWRPAREIVLAAEHAQSRGITVIGLTDSHFGPVARAADMVLVAPTESAGFFQSMTAPVSVVYGLIGCLYRIGGTRAQEMEARAERLWTELGISYSYPTPPPNDGRGTSR